MLIFDKQRESFQIIGYKQFDSLEPLKAQFLNNGTPINLTEYDIRFECKKPDGNIVIDDENIAVKNICEIEMLLNEQITIVNGNVKCQFVLVNKINEKQTSTFTFELDVQQSVININGYSSSLITVAERLNKDVIEARKLHNDLTQDIITGNQVKDELISKTNIANTTKDTLVEKTTEGNETVNQLIEKTAIAKQEKLNLESTIDSAIEKDDMLTRTTVLADTTNIALQQTVDGAKANIDKINSVGNKFIVVTSAQFNVGREYNWKHDMNSDNLVVNFIDSVTNEPLMPDYKIVDKNNMILRNSVEHPNIKVIASASNYQGSPLLGTTTEDFAETTVSIGSYVRLKDVNGYKYPITKSEAVYMPDGTTKLTDKINQIEQEIGQSSSTDIEEIQLQLAEIMNNIPSYSIINYAKFNRNNVKKGYEISLYGGLLQHTGGEYSDAVIDEFMMIDPLCKYEVLVYQAEDIYVTEYSGNVFLGQTRLANGYRWVYDGSYNLIDHGATYLYASQSAFSYFETKVGTNRIKVSFKFSESSTSPLYYPNSNTLMLDNAINSLKIVKVSEKGV